MVSDTPNRPLVADADDIPAEHRLLGIEGVRSFAALADVLPAAAHLGFRRDGDCLVLDGAEAQSRWYFSPLPDRRSGDMHVGVWHHIAYGAGTQAELQTHRDYAAAGPVPYTRVFDHYFFDSCYAMTPGGRLELCTDGPGFQFDEKLEDLGDRLCLSPRVEPLRAKLEAELPRIVNPRPRSGKDAPAAPAEPHPADRSGADETVAA
jgi:glyoxalase family protein